VTTRHLQPFTPETLTRRVQSALPFALPDDDKVCRLAAIATLDYLLEASHFNGDIESIVRRVLHEFREAK